MIAEAGPWHYTDHVEKVPPPPPAPVFRDPLIVAWDRVGCQNFLIDSFDLTPIEEMIRREFTEGKL